MRSSRSCVYIIQYKNACIIWMIWIVNSCDRASMIFQHDVHRFKHDYVRDSSPKRLHCCSYLNLATGSIDFSLFLFLCWFSIKSTLKKNWTTINIPVFLLLSLYGFSIFTNNSKWYEPFIYILLVRRPPEHWNWFWLYYFLSFRNRCFCWATHTQKNKTQDDCWSINR